jgi:hypothetical protein
MIFVPYDTFRHCMTPIRIVPIVCWKVSYRIARFFLTQYTKTGQYIPLMPLNYPKDIKMYQMAVIYFKWTINIPTFSIPRPSKIYPNWDLWFENMYTIRTLVSCDTKIICSVSNRLKILAEGISRHGSLANRRCEQIGNFGGIRVLLAVVKTSKIVSRAKPSKKFERSRRLVFGFTGAEQLRRVARLHIFKTKNFNLDTLWKTVEWKILLYFIAL